MTRQILLRTPRGNTAVVPVDHYLCSGGGGGYGCGDLSAGADSGSTGGALLFQQTKETLLCQLVEASRLRDVGRKRGIRSVSPEDDDDVQGGDGYGGGHEDDYEDSGGFEYGDGASDRQPPDGNDDEEEEEEEGAAGPDTMDVDEEQDGGGCCSSDSDRDHDDEEMTEATAATTEDDHDIARRMQSTCISSSSCQSCSYYRQRRPQPPQPHHCGQSSSPSFGGLAVPPTSSSPSTPQVALYHQGRKVTLDRVWEWITGTTAAETGGPSAAAASGAASSSSSSCAAPPQFPLYLTLSTTVRLLGGVDRQNRVGSKFGGGGVSSSQQSERERKDRLRQLALESIDLAKDPYLMRNHLGTYECKLCLTLHTNEANYLAHTQGKKHQQGLGRRAHMEKLRAERQLQQEAAAGGGGGLKQAPSSSLSHPPPSKRLRIGRPAYQVFKSRDGDTGQRCLSFEVVFPEIEDGLQPRHRFMSAYEQKVEVPPDRRYQYLLFAADPYETVAFKIPNEPIDREPGRFVTFWDGEEKKFTLTLYFLEEEGVGDGAKPGGGDDDEAGDDDNVKVGAAAVGIGA